MIDKRIIKMLIRAIFTMVLIAVITWGFLPAQVTGQCVPAYSQESFRKVYRNNKMFLEGVAELTGDGKIDAYGYEFQADGTYRNLVILPNNGSGGFGEPTIIPGTFPINSTSGRSQGHLYSGIVLADLNGDGKKDFVVRAATSPSAILVFFSNAEGGYTQSPPTITAVDEFVAFAGDLNGDGRGDLLTITVNSFIDFYLSYNNLGYRLGNADGTFGAVVEYEHQTPLVSPLVADFNADGKPDIAYTYYGNPNGYHLKVLINQGGGLFAAHPTQMNVDMQPMGTIDFNNDGKLDIWSNGILINNGQGFFLSRINLPTSPAPDFPSNFLYRYGYMTMMDYDGDGKDDLVYAAEGADTLQGLRKRYFTAYINDGAGGFTKSNFARPFMGVPGDVDGDGKDDQVIFVNSLPGTARHSGSNETAVIVRENTCTPQPVTGQNKLIDFGGEGASDVALWKGSTGQWRFYSNLIERTFNWGGASFGDTPAPADYDGDGKTDPAVFRNPTGDWWILRSSDGTVVAEHWGATGDLPVPADYNGDGKADIGVFRPSVGDWYISYTGASQYTFLHFGANGDVPVPADFDGDAKDNIAIFRPSTGDWFYLTSSFDNYVGLRWGTTNDIPIPGDYDMDGKEDIAVFRPSDGNWYIFRSFDQGFDFFHFGQSGDTPMLMDTNGDGVLEMGVTRPIGQSGILWLVTSQPLATLGIFGAPNEIPLRLGLPN